MVGIIRDVKSVKDPLRTLCSNLDRKISDLIKSYFFLNLLYFKVQIIFKAIQNLESVILIRKL